MRKFSAFIILTLICWGFVSAQTPDAPQGEVCPFPSVLDSLTGETPVCPTLGTSVVAIVGVESDSLVFTTPILGGELSSAMQAWYRVSVEGLSGFFYSNGNLNNQGTAIVGGVALVGDSALQGLDLRGRNITMAAQITGCHAADATDPTSSAGVVSNSATFTVPLPCPEFYNTRDSVQGSTYRLLSYIQLSSAHQYQNPHFVVKEGGDSITVSATPRPNFEFRSVGLPTNYWEGKIITFYPVLDVKCGSDMSSFVTIVGPSFTRSFLQCPELGNISLHSNGSLNPNLRADTLFVAVSSYSTAIVNGIGVTVTPQGSAIPVTWSLDQWNADHSAAYKILTLAQLQQLGLSTSSLAASVTANLTVNTNTLGCNNVTTSGQITFAPLPECPAFAPSAVTVAIQQSNGNVVVTTPLAHYSPALIYHTGGAGQDSLYYTLYRNTENTSQIGTQIGVVDAVYDSQAQTMTCTIPNVQLVPGARYDFIPHVNLTGYCNSLSDNYVTIDGPSGDVVIAIHCPSYSPSTLAVKNPDGSVTVTHQLVDYNPAMMGTSLPRFYAYDTMNVRFKTNTNVIISADGLMTCTFPASDFTAKPSHNVIFAPRIVVVSPCSVGGNGPMSNPVCISYSELPSFTAVSNTSGTTKVTLFTNEGVILKAKITGNVNQVARAGFLISRSPITGYSADKVVLGTVGGTTGDTLSYKVGMDSCGGVTYYRPFLVMKGCDSLVVLGLQKSFTMWAPDLTVSANPTSVAAGGSVTLNAAATMTVSSWNQPTSYGTPCQAIGDFTSGCGLVYTEDCSTTKNMEVWMYLLTGLRNCSTFWNNFHSFIENALGLDPGYADFQYRWERNGTTFFSTTSVSAAGVTTDTPTTTTVYTGVADFSYNGVHCIQKQNITVTVP